MTEFVFLACENPGCGLRFPRLDRDPPVAHCPRCGAPVRAAAAGSTEPEQTPATAARLPLHLLVDNVRSAFNVGSLLRSADAAGVASVTLCGLTPTPDHPHVRKTALGAELSVPWLYAPDALAAAAAARAGGATLWALEEAPAAVSLFDAPLPVGPLALIVGHEVAGVDPMLRTLADCTVALPMRGRKRSLNVAVAGGAALLLLAQRIGELVD